MSNKSKERQNVCRLTVVKLVDSGPITSNNTDTDECDIDLGKVSVRQPVIRHSPQQKRHISPVPTVNVVNHKKVKLEQSTNDIKKKPVQSVIKNENISKTTVNSKPTKSVLCKSSLVIESKITKTLPIKESNQTTTINDNTDNLSSLKPRASRKIIKSQSTNDIKPSIQTTINNTKKKESAPSPSKPKLVTNIQNGLKKPINKNSQKSSIKTEQTSTSTNKSPSNIIIKQESLLQPSSTNTASTDTNTSVLINNLKKIPKKPQPPPVVEKYSRSSISSSSLNRNSIRDSQGQNSVLSKTQSNLKRDRSLSSVNNSNSNNRSGETNITKNRSNHSTHQSANLSRHDQSNRISSSPPKSSSKNQIPTPPKFIPSPSQCQIDPPINSTIPSSSSSSVDTPQPLSTSSPSTHIFPNEDNHIQASMDIDDDHIQLSDKSNSPNEHVLIQPIQITSKRISHSDRSDIYDSDTSIDDGNEEEDLPTSLTNDDLRYKLIYIYKRFQLNSINDLTIFVRFFKRHQLIDISSLSMTKATNEMFTYDLFSLSPSHIGELASDLGYTTTNIITSMEE